MSTDGPDIWTDSPLVRDYMTRDLVTFKPDDDVWDVLDAFLDKRVTGAPVVGDDGELVGLVSEKDVLRLMSKGSPLGLPRRMAVSEVMSDTVVTIPPDMNVFTAASLFRHNPYMRLPVTEDGKLVGQISRSDLLRCMKDIGKL